MFLRLFFVPKYEYRVLSYNSLKKRACDTTRSAIKAEAYLLKGRPHLPAQLYTCSSNIGEYRPPFRPPLSSCNSTLYLLFEQVNEITETHKTQKQHNTKKQQHSLTRQPRAQRSA